MGQRRKKKLAGDVAAFLRQYGRKAYPTHDPNDRGYDRELEAKIQRMRPEELDALMRDQVEDRDEAADGGGTTAFPNS